MKLIGDDTFGAWLMLMGCGILTEMVFIALLNNHHHLF